jgi:hypothetical protein
MVRHAWFLRLSWTALSVLMLAADYVTGPEISFPVAYTVPVILAAWYSGRD